MFTYFQCDLVNVDNIQVDGCSKKVFQWLCLWYLMEKEIFFGTTFSCFFRTFWSNCVSISSTHQGSPHNRSEMVWGPRTQLGFQSLGALRFWLNDRRFFSDEVTKVWHWLRKWTRKKTCGYTDGVRWISCFWAVFFHTLDIDWFLVPLPPPTTKTRKTWDASAKRKRCFEELS